MPIYRALREQIGVAGIGRLVFCQIWQLMDLAPWDEPVAWRAAMPNRTLFEGGVHLVDLLMTLFGEKPLPSTRATRAARARAAADAIHLVTLEFSEERLAQITIDRLCKAGTRYVEVRADCEHASLRASHGGRALVQIGKKRAERTGLRLDFGQGGLAWVERGLPESGSPAARATRRCTRPASWRAVSSRRSRPAESLLERPRGTGRPRGDRGGLPLGEHRSADRARSQPQLTILGSGIGTMNRPPRRRTSLCCRAISSAKFQAITSM